MKTYVSIAVVVVVILAGVWLYSRGGAKDTGVAQNTATTPADQIATTPATTPANPINNQPTNQNKTMQATIHTNKGDITVEFFAKDAPNTVANFTKLAGSGFYTGVKFHRVIKGFMIQGGDPLTKDDTKMALWGTGGPGYQFADEINPQSALYQAGYLKGILAMANSGPNTNGSQFFIMTENYPLPPLYTIFGKVDAGQDVVDAIANVPTTTGDRPVDPVIINSITLSN